MPLKFPNLSSSILNKLFSPDSLCACVTVLTIDEATIYSGRMLVAGILANISADQLKLIAIVTLRAGIKVNHLLTMLSLVICYLLHFVLFSVIREGTRAVGKLISFSLSTFFFCPVFFFLCVFFCK